MDFFGYLIKEGMIF